MNDKYTIATLFNDIYEVATHAGELSKLAAIEDYHLPTRETLEITRYDFDVAYTAQYGGSEGIYIDAYLSGIFDESGEDKNIKIGTIKTLEDDLDAMKIMGEACGILTHFGRVQLGNCYARYVKLNSAQATE